MMMPQTQLDRTKKAGLVGCGRVGFLFDEDPKRTGIWTHAKAYDTHVGIKFVGVYDTNENLAKQCSAKYNTTAYSSIAILLEKQLDILSVATPPETHHQIIAQAIDADVPPAIIWVEKPFGGCYEIAQNLVDAAAQRNIKIHVDFQRRHCMAFGYVKSFGKPQHVSVVYTRGLLNTAVHFIDMMLGLFGNPCRVVAIDATDFVMIYDNFNVTFNMVSPQYNICEVILVYNDKIVRVPPIINALFIKNMIESVQYGEYNDLGDEVSCAFPYNPMLLQIDAMIYGGELNDGLATLAIVQALDSNIKQI